MYHVKNPNPVLGQTQNCDGIHPVNKLNIEFTIQTILYGSETSDYNQNVKLLRAVHTFIKRSKRFDNNIVI